MPRPFIAPLHLCVCHFGHPSISLDINNKSLTTLPVSSQAAALVITTLYGLLGYGSLSRPQCCTACFRIRVRYLKLESSFFLKTPSHRLGSVSIRLYTQGRSVARFQFKNTGKVYDSNFASTFLCLQLPTGIGGQRFDIPMLTLAMGKCLCWANSSKLAIVNSSQDKRVNTFGWISKGFYCMVRLSLPETLNL